jgi:TonB-linked SusC/RagA family outer membrane protein
MLNIYSTKHFYRSHSYFFLKTLVLLVILSLGKSLFAQSIANNTDSLTDSNVSVTYNPFLYNNSPYRNFGIVENKPTGVIYGTPEQIFAGRIAGVQVMETTGAPGGEFSVRLRGASALSGSSEPLYVIDGLPLDFFNENFGAPYGSGSLKGQAMNALSLINPDDIESFQVLKNASALAIYGTRATNGVVIITTKRNKKKGLRVNFESSYSIQKIARKTEMLDVSEYIKFKKYAALSNPEMVGVSNLFNGPESDYPNIDWMDEVSETGKIKKQLLEIGGGMDHLTYSVRGGLYNHEGIIKETGFDRKNVSVTLDGNFWKNRIKTGTSFYYADAGMQQKSTEGLIQTAPIGPAYDSDGAYHQLNLSGVRNPNPVEGMINGGSEKESSRLIFNNYLQVKIFENLFVKARYARSVSKNEYEFLPAGKSGNIASRDATSRFFESALTYTKSWKKYALHLNGGYSEQLNTDITVRVIGENEPALRWLREIRENFNDDNYILPPLPKNIFSTSTLRMTSNTKSLFIQSGLDISEKVFVNLNYRKDFLAKAFLNDFNATSFGAGLTWTLKQHVLNENQNFSSLKINVDAGKLGLINNAWDVMIRKEEESKSPDRKSISIGTEAGFFGDQVILKADLFNQVTRQNIVPGQVNLPQGQTINYYYFIDKMTGRGIDLSVSARITNSEKLKWIVSANTSYISNKIKSPEDIYGPAEKDVTKNKPVGSWILYKSNGVWNSDDEINKEYQGSLESRPRAGDARVDMANGSYLSLRDNVYSGSANAKFLLGTSSDITWNNFDVSFLIRGELGQKILNKVDADTYFGYFLDNVSKSSVTRAWRSDNPSSNYPAQGKGVSSNITEKSDMFLENGSFIRLQNLNIGYTISLWNDRSSARIYLGGQNLFLITKYRGWDPEVSSNGQDPLARGFDKGLYPRARTYTLGIQVQL